MMYPIYYLIETQSIRICVMYGLIVSWGLRLTFNLYRKGGYSSVHEDYRITFLFKTFEQLPVPRFISWTLFQIFNIGFIVIFQHLLLWGIAILPIHFVYSMEKASLSLVEFNTLDIAATLLFLYFLLIETIADNQMFNFQSQKHVQIKIKIIRTGDYALGFLTHGLFKYSRHPNFLGGII
jgi:steroid 5-alpha reductase family enzyme